MPFKAGKSFKDVNKGLDKFAKKVDKNIGRGLSAMAITGAGLSRVITPADTSNLVNSQFIEHPSITPSGWKVRIGYTANYAAAVHSMPGTLKGQPRSSVKSFNTSSGSTGFASNEGNFWDPNAEPQFLTKGFEGENLAAVQSVFYKALKV